MYLQISWLLFFAIVVAPPGQPYRQNTTIGPTIILEPGRVVIAQESFKYDDPSLPELITRLEKNSEKSAGGLRVSRDLALQVEADGQVLWSKLVEVVELARKAKFKRLAFPYLISSRSSLLGQIMSRIFPQRPPALIVILADSDDMSVESVKLPEILPFRAAFRKLQRAADRGKPIRLEVLKAAQKVIVRQAPSSR